MSRLRRKIDQYLIDWKNDKNKMPLIVKGARQIGKTDSIKNCAENNYKYLVEINFALDKQYLDIFDDPNPENLTPFMLKNVVIKPEWRHKIPAICHIDNTARPQYLKREVNPELYDLIEAFYKETGIPLLINTSFMFSDFVCGSILSAASAGAAVVVSFSVACEGLFCVQAAIDSSNAKAKIIFFICLVFVVNE